MRPPHGSGPAVLGSSHHYDLDYRETVRAAPRLCLRFRLIRPTDAPLIQDAFRRLSPESRYNRFLTAKRRLNGATLRHLTTCDGIDHVAITALRFHGWRGEQEIVGVARFVRLEDPTQAELAVAVIDACQERGIGGLLVRRLCQAARERGIARFHAYTMPENSRMIRLAQRIDGGTRVQREDNIVRLEFTPA